MYFLIIDKYSLKNSKFIFFLFLDAHQKAERQEFQQQQQQIFQEQQLMKQQQSSQIKQMRYYNSIIITLLSLSI